ncbi:MAG TPA: hypothetical protein VJZ70_01925, partial [Limnochordia bacterium]|nr:hypothetical protein [Limnochordia bacterium]
MLKGTCVLERNVRMPHIVCKADRRSAVWFATNRGGGIMSQPTFPEFPPISRDDAISMILSSIAM